MRDYANLNKEHDDLLRRHKMIEIIKNLLVRPTERHFEVKINGKFIQFAKWVEDDFSTDYEFIKGKNLLNEDEYEDMLNFIEEQEI